jgi:hypothetical protein
MTAMELNTKKMEVFREILDIEDENVLTGTIAFIRKARKTEAVRATPPEGFMTGDEFERRVKARVTKFYQENGLL